MLYTDRGLFFPWNGSSPRLDADLTSTEKTEYPILDPHMAQESVGVEKKGLSCSESHIKQLYTVMYTVPLVDIDKSIKKNVKHS